MSSGSEGALAPASTLVTPGEVIGGKFRVDHVIGEGGMGIVVAATHLQLGERVALKFLRREAMKNEDVVARFAQEARAAARLKSHYVARVLDVGTWEDVPFMVMEFLEGRDLGNVLAAEGALPIEEAAEYVIQACEGLAEAHARGIVHRDVKPENIFLTQHDGWKSVKLLDFGISKAALSGLGAEVSTVKTSAIMGSPCYMSPEQLRSTKNVDHRADIWSLGAVLFELLTGTTPYDSNVSLTQLVAMVLEEPPGNLRALRPEAPPELEQAVLRCLKKDPAQRFQTVAELAVALLPFAPRRARLAAERAISLTRAAGLSDTDLKLPPSIFPPSAPVSGSPSDVVHASGVRIAPQLLPNEYRSSSPNRETGSALVTAATVPGETKLAKRRLWAIPVALLAVLVALGVGWTLRGGGEKQAQGDPTAKPTSLAPPTAAASLTPAAVVTQEPVAIPSAVAPGTASAEGREAAGGVTTATHANAPHVTKPTAEKPAKPAASAPAPSGGQDLDIRLTR